MNRLVSEMISMAEKQMSNDDSLEYIIDNNLSKDEMKLFLQCADGATIFDRHTAELFRKIQKLDSSLLTIIDDMKELARIVGKKNITNEKGEQAYFGIKATPKGRDTIESYCKRHHYIWLLGD